jgi:hypothetical protein
MPLGNRSRPGRPIGFLTLAAHIMVASIGTVRAQTAFFDDFNGPGLKTAYQAALPNAGWRFGSPYAVYNGPPNYSFQHLGGVTVIRIQDMLNDAQRTGWSSSEDFRATGPIRLEARFNTVVQSPTTAIDELLELWILDSTNLERYDKVALSAPDYGAARVFTAGSSITNTGLDTLFAFANNTWYRLVISGSPTQQIRLSVFDDSGSAELIGVNTGHTLASYPSGFKIGFSQSMGLPGTAYPTDVAVDWIRLQSYSEGQTIALVSAPPDLPEGTPVNGPLIVAIDGVLLPSPEPATVTATDRWAFPFPSASYVSSCPTCGSELTMCDGSFTPAGPARITFVASFVLPANFANPFLSMRTTNDDAANVFLNGNFVGRALTCCGGPEIYPGHLITTLATTNRSYFRAGTNELRYELENFNAPCPTSMAYTATVGFSTVTADLDGDGRITCADLAIVRAAFGKRQGQAGFDLRADVNVDGVIDIRDLAFVAQRLPAGTRCP